MLVMLNSKIKNPLLKKNLRVVLLSRLILVKNKIIKIYELKKIKELTTFSKFANS